jgi:hypothetical protein
MPVMIFLGDDGWFGRVYHGRVSHTSFFSLWGGNCLPIDVLLHPRDDVRAAETSSFFFSSMPACP